VQALIVAAAGVILAAGAAAAGHRARGESGLALLTRLLIDETVPLRARAARSLGIVLVGVAIVLEPGPALTVATIAAGLFVLYRGAEGVLRAAAEAAARVVSGERRRPLAPVRGPRGRRGGAGGGVHRDRDGRRR
jgi:hypothetical protein